MALTTRPVLFGSTLDPDFQTENEAEALAHDAALGAKPTIDAYVDDSGRFTSGSKKDLASGEKKRLLEFTKHLIIKGVVAVPEQDPERGEYVVSKVE